MHFLIAYDIAEPRRLRRVAACLEARAQRVQKSVFTYEGTHEGLKTVFASLFPLIDVHEDCIQAWTLLNATAVREWRLGTALPARLLSIVISPQGTLMLEDTP